jgi:predicted nucleic acid-binding protein
MMTGTVVIDASVVVEYLVELKFTEEATRFFAGLVTPGSDLELWAPDLIFPEAASALRKLVQRRAIAAEAGARAVARLARLPIVATGSAGLLAAMWKFRQAVTMYDACYLTLAARLRAPVLTADARLARARPPAAPRVVFLGEL